MLFSKLCRIDWRILQNKTRSLIRQLDRNYVKNVSKESIKLSYNTYEDSLQKADAKPPLIILHGLFGNKNNWHSVAKLIPQRTGRKVITVDARNHGESPHVPKHNYEVMREDVCRLLDELAIKKCILVGHSMGGKTAMNLALTKPSYIEKLVVVDVSPFSTPHNLQIIKYAEAMRTLKFPEGIPLSKARKKVNVILEPLVENEGVRQFLLSSITDAGNNTFRWQFNIEALCDQLPSIFSPQSFTTTFSGPTIFIRGGKSDYLKQSDESVIQERFFPKATFHTILGAGHFVHAEKPTEFLNVLCDFVNEEGEFR